jgi:hypothetical protein
MERLLLAKELTTKAGVDAMERVAHKGAPVSHPRGARRRLIGQISDRLFRDLEATVLAARGLLEPPAGRKETRADSPPS